MASLSLTNLVGCVGLVNEAYNSFKASAHASVCAPPVAAAAAASPSPALTASPSPDNTDPDTDQKKRTREHALKFWLMFGVYAYAEPWADATIGRLPLYSLLKLCLTSALVAPSPAARELLFGYFQPGLVRADTALQRHLRQAVRRLAYFFHRCLLIASESAMRHSLRYLSESQLEEVQQRTNRLTHAAKKEKIHRLKESVNGLELTLCDESMVVQDESSAGAPYAGASPSLDDVGTSLRSLIDAADAHSGLALGGTISTHAGVLPSRSPAHSFALDSSCMSEVAEEAEAADPDTDHDEDEPDENRDQMNDSLSTYSAAASPPFSSLPTPSSRALPSVIHRPIVVWTSRADSDTLSVLRERTGNMSQAQKTKADREREMKKKRQTMGV